MRLAEGGAFQFHRGIVQHADILGQDEGICVHTSLDRLVWAYRPRMQDYVMEMQRNSAIVYPKDIAFVLVWGDIFPGARVFEAGVGSGAMAIAILRAIGAAGQLVSYELREDMIARAQANVHAFHGPTENWAVHQRDAYETIDDGPFDRMFLDLPEPGRVAPHAAGALKPGGILCTYLPNATQVDSTVAALRESGAFAEIETYETLYRPWVFRGQSARPAHVMVGHTGFLTFARRSLDRARD
ncbi:MAG: tRNA (adenine57-N1/adenine58-N1)-methyltransferase catalytic subunit [Chloroflexota bacterium]|nr:tRNA (adenine57-N1/adenine58-N1)-methyltransferase catalytic subunit [Chloroflexota bacterium]